MLSRAVSSKHSDQNNKMKEVGVILVFVIYMKNRLAKYHKNVYTQIPLAGMIILNYLFLVVVKYYMDA